MEKIYQSEKIVVLRIDNETEYNINPNAVRPEQQKFTVVAGYYHRNPNEISHLPLFPKKKLYIDLGGTLRWFIPTKSVCGFSYRQDDGEWSLPFIATFCEMEGVDNGQCVILGKYSQSYDNDGLDNASPFGDLPCGRMDFWSNQPDVFYKDETAFQEKRRVLPRLRRTSTNFKEHVCETNND